MSIKEKKKIFINRYRSVCVFKIVSIFLLIGTKQIDGSAIRNEYCPISGLYHFKYNINNNSAISLECNTFSSEFSNCPDGSILHLKFKRCNFEARGKSSFSRF